MAALSPQATPKRKRDGDASLSPIKFSFDLSKTGIADDGSNSPRSKIAHRFRGLAIGSGGGVATDDADDGDTPNSARKRQRPDEVMVDAGEADLRQERGSPAPRPIAAIANELNAGPSAIGLGFQLPVSTVPMPEPQLKSPRRRRAGTPPLKLNKSPPTRAKIHAAAGEGESSSTDQDEDDIIVDPVRAALTWHDDEITIYDPNDEDDDGTGINGVGFRPTPAIAHARAMRRRHQMAEYRKREESEARAKRSQRRRGEGSLSAKPKSSSPRKVRFVDTDRQNVAVTTQ